jgi:hypothetical protein
MGRTRGGRRTALLAAAAGLVAGVVLGAGAVAYSAGTLTTAQGNTLTQVKVVRDGNPTATTSTSFVDVPGATTTISVPAGTKALILARFSATSTCVGPAQDSACFLRIMIYKVGTTPTEAFPNGVNISTFDSEVAPNVNAVRKQAHMIERSRGGLTAGDYVVDVQDAVPGADTTLALVNWNLTVERIKS